MYIYIYTRVDPCIKCTRSKLDTGQGVLGLVAPEDLLSVCCLVLPLVLSSVVLSPLVSSCLGFSALVSSCVVCWASPGPFLGLSRASLGAPGGPWGPGHPLGSLLAALGPLLARRLLGPPLGRLGRLLAAESEFSRNLVKTKAFAWLLHDFGPSGGLLAPSWRLLGGSWGVLSGLGCLLGGSWAVLSGLGWLLGGSWAVLSGLGWLLGRPKWSWVVSGWPWSRPWVGPGSPHRRRLRRPVRIHCIDR